MQLQTTLVATTDDEGDVLAIAVGMLPGLMQSIRDARAATRGPTPPAASASPPAVVVPATPVGAAPVTDISTKRTGKKAKEENAAGKLGAPVNPQTTESAAPALVSVASPSTEGVGAPAVADPAAQTAMPWDEPAAAPAAPVPTIDAMREALKAYSDRTSIKSALALVQRFGGTRLSDIKESHWAAFIADCATAGDATLPLPGAGSAA